MPFLGDVLDDEFLGGGLLLVAEALATNPTPKNGPYFGHKTHTNPKP